MRPPSPSFCPSGGRAGHGLRSTGPESHPSAQQPPLTPFPPLPSSPHPRRNSDNANATLTCPVEPGTYTLEQTVELPKEIPRAKFAIDVLGVTAEDEDMLCLKLYIGASPVRAPLPSFLPRTDEGPPC